VGSEELTDQLTPVRIALVGAGRMGRVQLRALKRSPSIEVAAVIEPSAAARAAVAADVSTVYETPEQFLDDCGAEAVLIAAPSDQHLALVTAFAAAGLSMLCEKPVGVSVSEAIAAAEAAQHAGVVLQVGYWRRFVPELIELRRRIRAGALGDIVQLSCMQWDAEPARADFRAHSGGICIDMGVHEFDQTRWLLGQEIDWIAALPAGPSSVDPAPAADPDAATILLSLSGGTTGTVSLGRRFPFADSCWLEVWGTHGYERVPFMWDRDGERVFVGALVAQAQAFAGTVRADEGACEGADGADAVAALIAAERAAELLAQATERTTPRAPTVAR
jgi:myo-inositol 2-dehydrogenase/D-chiro-inositol 1-dehydrogenase